MQNQAAAAGRAPRPRIFYPLRSEQTPAGLQLFTPPIGYWGRGLLSLTLIPGLALLVWVLLDAFLEPDPLGSMILLGAAIFLAALGAIAGVCLILLSPWLSNRTRLHLTRNLSGDAAKARYATQTASGRVFDLSAAASVSVRHHGMLGELRRLAIIDASGHELCVVHDQISSAFDRELAHTVQELNAFLGTEHANPALSVQPPPGVFAPTPVDRTVAMLCYLPVQGIFLIASLICLIAVKSPYVRRAAKQSLLQFAFSTSLLLLMLLVLGTPIALSDGDPPAWLIVLLSAALGIWWVWNLGAHIYACVRFYRGDPWLMPWLAPVARRWFPAE